MIKKIVILGDSLGMVSIDDGVSYENTYPYLLKKMACDFEVISRNRRTNDSTRQLEYQNKMDDVVMLKPNYVIVQLGIVDCAPRVFGKLESKILSLISPAVRSHIVNFASKNRRWITKFFPRVYVRCDRYASNMMQLVRLIMENGAVPILIHIFDTNESNRIKSFGIEKNIRSYNEVLSRIAADVTIPIITHNGTEKYMAGDGIHLNRAGHVYLAGRLMHLIKSLEADLLAGPDR